MDVLTIGFGIGFIVSFLLFLYYYRKTRIFNHEIQMYDEMIKYLKHIIDMRDEEIRELRTKYGLLKKQYRLACGEIDA